MPAQEHGKCKAMIAIKARFDGKKIILPKTTRNAPPGEVIIVFTEAQEREKHIWLKAQEAAFARVWDNDEDAVYDNLRAKRKVNRYPLRGSVYRYDDPTDPVAEDDWEALR